MIYDVIIIGAGPIGLMLANLLGQKNISTLIIEKKSKKDASSKAIGITPPSLEILHNLQLTPEFVKKGVKIDTAIIHGAKKRLGDIDFRDLPLPYNYILAIPQIETESILEKNLEKYKCIEIKKEFQFMDLQNNETNLIINTMSLENQTRENYTARYLCACDGKKSHVRQSINIPFRGGPYHNTFLMGDFHDKTGFGTEAHLFFTPFGAVESFPLPQKQRRWIIQTENYMKEVTDNYLEKTVLKRTGIKIHKSNRLNLSPFGVQHFMIDKYYHNNIIFCGDSAHIMSPIGGQGMNTGFADTQLACFIIEKLLKQKNGKSVLLNKYNRYRKIAGQSAINRANYSMGIGTLKGHVSSSIRNFIIKTLLMSPLKKMIPWHFSMLNIPNGTLHKIKDKVFI